MSWKLLPVVGALAAVASATGGDSKSAAGAERDRAAFETLTAAEKKDAADYLRLECSRLGTFQQSLLRHAAGLLDTNVDLLPEPTPVRWFDPARHAPAQPIPRRELEPDARAVTTLRGRVFARVPKSLHEHGYVYDFATGSVRRLPRAKEPGRIFANAWNGFAPDLDLATALVERALDDGGQQKTLAAFAHAYTDRAGGVYPGITLYDAWASGAEIEMPDVDCLGIVHDVLDDWKRWVAPVVQQEPLYSTIGTLFERAHRHMGLRRALAACWADGDAVLRDGYQGTLDNLHTLWEAHSSNPAELATKLPKPDDWALFLEAWTKTCHADGELYQRGKHRHKTLANDALAVQATARRVLQEFGAYERLDKAAKELPTPR